MNRIVRCECTVSVPKKKLHVRWRAGECDLIEAISELRDGNVNVSVSVEVTEQESRKFQRCSPQPQHRVGETSEGGICGTVLKGTIGTSEKYFECRHLETLYRYRERLFNDVRQTVVIHIGDIEQYRFRGQSCRRQESAIASAEELKQRVRKRSWTDDIIVDGNEKIELAVVVEVGGDHAPRPAARAAGRPKIQICSRSKCAVPVSEHHTDSVNQVRAAAASPDGQIGLTVSVEVANSKDSRALVELGDLDGAERSASHVGGETKIAE